MELNALLYNGLSVTLKRVHYRDPFWTFVVSYIYIYICVCVCVCVCVVGAVWLGVRVPIRARHFLSLNFDTFITVQDSKMNAVARTQLTFQMLTLLQLGSIFGPSYIYIYIYIHIYIYDLHLNIYIYIYMNDINNVNYKLDFISYADDTTLTSPLCSFTHGANNDVSHVWPRINSE